MDAFKLPPLTTIRSLECWSIRGCAGDKLSDAFAARAALAAKCRYGLEHYGRLVFVFLPGVDLRVEREKQAWLLERRPTLQQPFDLQRAFISASTPERPKLPLPRTLPPPPPSQRPAPLQLDDVDLVDVMEPA